MESEIPESFGQLFPKTRAVMKIMEIHVKSGQNFKFLLGLTPHGRISFVSKVFSEQLSDNELISRSGIYDLIQPEDTLMLISDNKKGPPFSKNDFSNWPQVVETTFEEMKLFDILQLMEKSLTTQVDRILLSIAFIVNNTKV
jgi:hypothetical protein